jgi:hypothetical protein
MKHTRFLFIFFCFGLSYSQVYTFKSQDNGTIITHRILMDEEYFVETQYIEEPPQFLLTRGGFYELKDKQFMVNLEFNSKFEQDGMKQMNIESSVKTWDKISKPQLELDGKWLMAGRVSNNKEQRRDITRPRKTMKFLKDGFFQWMAFNTETFQFFGSGGGYYSAEEERYTEHIEYFSRNNTSVGRVLPFEYFISGIDWHHQGFSSKGNPIHEIWSARAGYKNE